MSDRQDIDRVREAVDLVALVSEFIPLEQKGNEWVGLCPFHDDHKPSMRVVTRFQNEFYKCFSCGAGGDCFDFVEKYLKMSFGEALRFLAERNGIELQNRFTKEEDGTPRTQLRKAMEWATGLYIEALGDDSGEEALAQLRKRGFTEATIQQFSLGVAPDSWSFLADKLQQKPESVEVGIDAGLLKKNEERNRVYDTFRNRIMFPILDESGSPIGFGGRRLNEEDEPKYINSPENTLFHKSKTLYGFNFARKSIQDKKVAIVVEGYTDVIACHQAGVTNVVATLGTALTSNHADKLSRIANEVILVFDGDVAGQNAADRAVEIFFKKNIDVRICVLPEGADPADLASDTETFASLLDGALGALEFKFSRLDESINAESTLAGQTKHIESFLNDLARLGVDSISSSKRMFVYERIAALLHVSLEEVQEEIKKRIPATRSSATQSNEVEPKMPVSVTDSKARQLAEKELLAVMVFDPTEASAMLRSKAQELKAEQFLHPSAHAIASYVLPKLHAGTLFTIAELGNEIGNEYKNIAYELTLLGERLAKENLTVMNALKVTIASFQKIIQNQSIRAEVQLVQQSTDEGKKEQAAQQAIDSIRRRGKNAGSSL